MATAVLTDVLLVGKVFNYISNRGCLTLSELLKAPSPLATKLPTEDAAIMWLKDNLSTDKRFAVEEDRENKTVTSVKVVSKVRMCLHYVESGTCPTRGGCKFWHVCKDYIEGNCEKKCRYGKSHDFHDEENGGKTEQLGFGKLESGAVRRIVSFNLPRVCPDFVQGSCVDINCLSLHLCAGFVQRTCFDSSECNQSHNLRSDHNKSILKKYGLNSSLKEIYILCNVLLPKNVVAPNIAGNNFKAAAEENISKLQSNIFPGDKCANSGVSSKPKLSTGRPLFKSQAGSQRQAYQSIPRSLNLNVQQSPEDEEETLSSEDNESVDCFSGSRECNANGSETKAGNMHKVRKKPPSKRSQRRAQLHRNKGASQSVGNVDRLRGWQSFFFPTQGVPPPHAKESIFGDPLATSAIPPVCNTTGPTSVRQPARLSQPFQMQGVGSGDPRDWVGKGRGMRTSAPHQDDCKRPGNRTSDCCTLPIQRCEYPEDAAEDGKDDDSEAAVGLGHKKKRTRARDRRRSSKTNEEKERKAGEGTEFQVNPPSCNFPEQPESSQKVQQ